MSYRPFHEQKDLREEIAMPSKGKDRSIPVEELASFLERIQSAGATSGHALSSVWDEVYVPTYLSEDTDSKSMKIYAKESIIL